MKATVALHQAAVRREPVAGSKILFHVKQFLLRRISFLCSKKFAIFAGATGAAGALVGMLADDAAFAAASSLIFAVPFAVSGTRAALRENRQINKGVKSVN